MEKKPRITAEEIKFLQDNCLQMADWEIAKRLNRDIKTIRRTRKKLGIIKGSKTSLNKEIVKKVKNKDKVPKTVLLATQKLTEDQRKKFFEKEFTNSINYQVLQKQLTDDEIEFYIAEWGSLCVQFEDILATEKRQLEELIKSEIIGNRIMSNVKLTEDYITILQKEIEDFRSKNDLTVEENQKRDESLMFMVQKMASISSAMTNDYHKNLEVRNKLLESLNGRRRDRIEQLKKSGVTFAGIVQALRDRETRNIQGRHMELVKMATEKKMNEFRKPIIFPDGSKSPILLDDMSVLDKTNERLILDDQSSLFIEEVKLDQSKKVLIIDTDQKSIKLLKNQLVENDVSVVGSLKDADIECQKNYDLICLGSDLNDNSKTIDLIHTILDQGLCEGSKFLIHTNNQENSDTLRELLAGKRQVEVFELNRLEMSGVNNA